MRDVAKNREGFYIDGLTQARAALAALPQAFKDVAAETIDEGTDIILNEAFARAPVGHYPDVHPGLLKRSLGKNTREDGLQATVGDGAVDAKFVELGTSDTPAQPYLFPAYRIGARYIRQAMKDWSNEAASRVTSPISKRMSRARVSAKLNASAKASRAK